MTKMTHALVMLSLLASTAIQAAPIEIDLGASNANTSAFSPSPAAQVYTTSAQENYKLAAQYHNGNGVPQNLTQALELYRKAADQGHALSQFFIGVMYYNGRGIPQNLTQALEWFKKAADQGHADAQYNMGAMHYKGRGVPQNLTQALEWFKKAADQGDGEAQFSYYKLLLRAKLYEFAMSAFEPQNIVAATAGLVTLKFLFNILGNRDHPLPVIHPGQQLQNLPRQGMALAQMLQINPLRLGWKLAQDALSLPFRMLRKWWSLQAPVGQEAAELAAEHAAVQAPVGQEAPQAPVGQEAPELEAEEEAPELVAEHAAVQAPVGQEAPQAEEHVAPQAAEHVAPQAAGQALSDNLHEALAARDAMWRIHDLNREREIQLTLQLQGSSPQYRTIEELWAHERRLSADRDQLNGQIGILYLDRINRHQALLGTDQRYAELVNLRRPEYYSNDGFVASQSRLRNADEAVRRAQEALGPISDG